MEMNRLAVVLAAAVSCTGCASLMGESIGTGDRGRILISADREGMRALGDTLTGLVVTGKAAPNTVDPHHTLRSEQNETERVKALIIGAKLSPVNQGEGS